MVKELRESASSCVNITGGGTSITFHVPVDIEPDGDVLDNSGIIQWGAEDIEGQSIQYLLGGLNDRQLLRRVLDGSGNPVGSDVILANNIRSDSSPPNALMFVGSPVVNPTVINIEVSAQKDVILGRTMQATLYSQVKLRN